MDTLKTRFAPSPTGHLHVGGARTALFNWLLARQTGGTFLLRIEDTDRARHDEAAVGKILEDLRWLGLEWDEGIEVGGPAAPYRQSERLEIYRGYVRRLLEEGKAYHAFETAEELDAMRAEAEQRKQTFRYPRPERFPDEDEVRAAREAGRPVVVRLACPAGDVTVCDDAFGEVVTPAEQVDDFILLKADGFATYHLANVVDDALMGVNYVMRGQEFLGQSWRHVLLREALDFPPIGYCHLPLIMDMQGRKLSKRDGDVDVHSFRRAGYLPEALVNFLALLGWRPGGDVEKLTLAELVDRFGTDRVGKANAKFDRDKLLAFNTDALAAATDSRVLEALQDYLALNETPLPEDRAVLEHVVRCTRGARTVADIVAKVAVLFEADRSYPYDDKAVKKVLRKNEGEGLDALAELRGALAEVRDWTAQTLEAWIGEYCRQRDLKMGKVAQPLRVAVTGTTVSPGIGDTLELLGREKTLARIDRTLAEVPRDA
jgi:glutamyl-tRNA synthetase